MEGKISVIVPIYNQEQYLNKSISSIINQKYDNLEIILINDLEKPNSIVRKIYNRIEYLCDPQKYVAYALKKNTLAWKKIEDIENLQKAISIDLEENEDNLVVSHNLIEIGYRKYWKLYLMEEKKNVQIMYVKYDALCLMNPYKV